VQKGSKAAVQLPPKDAPLAPVGPFLSIKDFGVSPAVADPKPTASESLQGAYAAGEKMSPMDSKSTAIGMPVVYSLAHMVLPRNVGVGPLRHPCEGDCASVCCTGGSSQARQEIGKGRYI
jgi:hypothetical protein